MTDIWIPLLNPDHKVRVPNWDEVDTWTVTKGKKSVKQLIKQDFEDVNREWTNPAGQPLPDASLKGLATAYKNKYKLDSLTIKDQEG